MTNRLEDLEKLEDGWDGYSAPKIPKDVIDNALTLLSSNILLKPEIYPTGRETVQFEIELENSLSLEIEVFGDRYETSVYNKHGRFMDFTIAEDLDEFSYEYNIYKGENHFPKELEVIKQVIVVRKDLNMRKGKIASQSAHASMKVFFDRLDFDTYEADDDNVNIPLNITHEMFEWIKGSFKKIVVYVNSEEEILLLKRKADLKGLPTALIEDNGYTEFHGVKTVTALAIGPGESDEIDEITGLLPLL